MMHSIAAIAPCIRCWSAPGEADPLCLKDPGSGEGKLGLRSFHIWQFFLRVAGFKVSTLRFHISLLLECRNSNDNTKPIWSITYVKLNQKVSQSTVQRDSMSTRLRNNQIDISTAVVSFDRTTVSIIKVISPPVALDPMISIKFSCIKRVVLPNEFWMQCMKCSVHGVPLNGLVQWRK